MRPYLVVILPPDLDLMLGFVQCHKPVLVEALVAKLAVEALDEAILDRFARPDEIQPDTAPVRPGVQSSSGKFRPVVQDT